MRNVLFIVMILFITNYSCTNSKSSPVQEYEYNSYPSFHEGFNVKFNPKKNEITFEKHFNVYLADSIRGREYFQIMDSISIDKIKKYIPQGSTETKVISDYESRELSKLFEKLVICSNEENIPGCDGITNYFSVIENEKTKSQCKYWSPREDSDIGKAIITLSDILYSIYKENSEALNCIEDSRRYLDNKSLVVRSENPLYIKLLESHSNFKRLEKDIEDLPKAQQIFIDLTNYEGEDRMRVATAFRKKYGKIKWITSNMFMDYEYIFR